MDWDKLRTFYAVAEAGSFTHAGETLHLSQSAISRQISGLEESIGVALFHRHARGLVLTEQGELLFKTAKEVFGRLSMVEGQLQDTREMAVGPLQITAAEFIGTTWLVPRLADFRSRYPDIQLTLILEDRILNLGMREADCAIRLYKPEQQDLIQRQLATINFHVCASRNYLERHGTPSSAAELKHHTLLGFPEGVPLPLHNANWLFRVADIDLEIDRNLIMMNSYSSIYEAVRNDVGIAALPDYLAENDDNLVMLLPDACHEGVDMYFVYPEERRNSRRIQMFRDFLVEHIQKTKF
jgi:DNA-binding transcriptional LysR family regulator